MSLTFEQYDMSPDPGQIQEIYDSGFRGTLDDQFGMLRFRGSLPSFYDAFPAAKGVGAGRLSLPYRAALHYDPDFGIYERQTTGDCVSHAVRNAGMLDYCMDAMFGETTYEGRLATEPQYGYRGHRGQGADCARLGEYISPLGPGGLLPRQQYTSADGRHTVDLSVYDSSIGHNWGGSGTPGWLDKIAANNKAARVMKITRMEEMRDASALGFGVFRCHTYAFENVRNEFGFAKRDSRKTWYHAEAIIAFDDTEWCHNRYGGGSPLEQNSWGEWNHGPKRLDQPGGSYWIFPRTAQDMLRRGAYFVVASVRGYNRTLATVREAVQDTVVKQLAELSA